MKKLKDTYPEEWDEFPDDSCETDCGDLPEAESAEDGKPFDPALVACAKLGVNGLCQDAYRNAFEHGFYDYSKTTEQALISMGLELEAHNTQQKLTKLALIGSEVGEAVRAVQHGDSAALAEELADVCIRVFDMCGWLDIELGDEIIRKMAINRTRPYMHGKKA
jgi:NTP pyrophosphatase (non-canonical NTP hydrolase)